MNPTTLLTKTNGCRYGSAAPFVIVAGEQRLHPMAANFGRTPLASFSFPQTIEKSNFFKFIFFPNFSFTYIYVKPIIY